MTSEREPTARELQERLEAALTEVALLRWQLDATTQAGAVLEAETETLTRRLVQAERAPVRPERLPAEVVRGGQWVANERAAIERRRAAMRR